MKDLYNSLGFKKSDIVVNPYGIKILIGTKGEDDWCVEVPKELVTKKYGHYYGESNYTAYFIAEQEALKIAEEYTNVAKSIETSKKMRGW